MRRRRCAVKFKSKTTGGDKLARKLERIGSKSTDSLGIALGKAVLMLHGEAVRGVATLSSGEKQTRYNPTREVTASKPGDPPNVDFGVFLKSIQFEVDLSSNTGYVGSNDKRAPWFEFGTKNMRPRPWLTPAIKAKKEDILRLFKNIKFGIGD